MSPHPNTDVSNEQPRVTIVIPATTRGGRDQLFYEAHDRQNLFHLTCAPNVLYGGAAGGGKSHGLRMDAYLRCISQPGFRALLLRRTFPELRNTHIDRMITEVPQLGGIFGKSENVARWPNGSTLEVGHCEDDASVAKYLSTEYDAIYFDELVTFTEMQFKFISSRARTTKAGVKPMTRSATNPGGANSAWVRRYFITKDISHEDDPQYNPDEWVYIPATLDDNPYIDPTYEARLMALPSEALRRAYRFGDWDCFEGQYFSEWRATAEDGRPWHVIHELPSWKGVPINEVPWIEVFRSLDWGYRDHGVVGWYAALPDGRLIKFQEYVFKECLAKNVAREVKRRSLGMRIRYTVADPNVFMRDGSTGESIGETFSRNGVTLIPADNERLNGWHRLHSWLRETTKNSASQDVPMLQVYGRECPYTVRTIPAQIIDPVKPEDLKTRGTEDHAADETRYAVMSRPAPSREQPYKRRYTKGTVGYDIQQLLKKATRRRRLGEESRRDGYSTGRTLYRGTDDDAC